MPQHEHYIVFPLTQNSNWMRQIVDVAKVIPILRTFPKRVKICETFVYQRQHEHCI